MSDPYKNLEEQLRDAVERRAPAVVPSPRRRRLRFTWPRGGAIPVLLGAVVLGGGVATAAVVVQHGSGATSAEQIAQAMDAGSKAMGTLPACRHAKSTRPRLVNAPAPAWLTAKLGILRRPQTAADRATGKDLRFAPGSMVLRDSLRVSVQPDGWSYRFLLTRGIGSSFPAQSDPVGCMQGARSAAVAAAASFPPDVQQRVRDTEDAEVAGAERLASGKALQYQITEVRPDGFTTSSGGGSVASDRGPVPATSGTSTYHHGRTRGHSVYALIPDGIATIRITDTAGTPREKPITVKVVDNFFHAILPRHFGPTMTLQWRAPSGRVVRTTHLHY